MYKQFSLIFVDLPNFDLLPRPDKLLLFGLYDQWCEHKCMPLHFNEINYRWLIRLTGIANLNMCSLHEKKKRNLMRYGVFFLEDGITFVVKPEENAPADLTKLEVGKRRKSAARSKKQSINGKKVSVSGKKQAARSKAPTPAAVVKPRLHPNFSPLPEPKSVSAKNRKID